MCERERASETALSKKQKSAEWMAARPPINCVPSRLLLAHTHRHARTTRRGGDGGCALKIIRESRLVITTCPRERQTTRIFATRTTIAAAPLLLVMKNEDGLLGACLRASCSLLTRSLQAQTHADFKHTSAALRCASEKEEILIYRLPTHLPTACARLLA